MPEDMGTYPGNVPQTDTGPGTDVRLICPLLLAVAKVRAGPITAVDIACHEADCAWYIRRGRHGMCAIALIGSACANMFENQ